MFRFTRRRVWFAAALLAALLLVVFFFRIETTVVEWLSKPPPNGPPHFAFLGNQWGWRAYGLWNRIRGRKAVTVGLQGHVMEFESLAMLTNLPRPLLETTNVHGDRLWAFAAAESLLDKFQNRPDTTRVSSPSLTWLEGNPATFAVQDQIPVGPSNRLVSVGWTLSAWINRGPKDSVRLTFFAESTERDNARMRWESNRVMELGVRTNAWFGARVTVPTNGSVFLLSSQRNSEGKHVGAFLFPKLP